MQWTIYFLVHCADCALKQSAPMLDDECLFGLSSSSVLTGCDEALGEDFEETKGSNSDER